MKVSQGSGYEEALGADRRRALAMRWATDQRGRAVHRDLDQAGDPGAAHRTLTERQGLRERVADAQLARSLGALARRTLTSRRGAVLLLQSNGRDPG